MGSLLLCMLMRGCCFSHPLINNPLISRIHETWILLEELLRKSKELD
jgi:hypothetical protein